MRIKPGWILSLILLPVLSAPALSNSLSVDDYTTGVQLYNGGQFARATQALERAMRLNPAHSSALYYDALCYQKLGETERARALLLHVVSVFPQSAAAGLAVKVLSEIAHPSKRSASPTIAAVTQPSAGAPHPDLAAVDQHLAKAQSLIDNKRDSEAEHSFIEAEHRAEHLGSYHPKLSESLARLGDYYANHGDAARAVNIYRREAAIAERNLGRNSVLLADRMHVHANAYTAEGDYNKSEDLLRRCIDIYQRNIDDLERRHLNSAPDSGKMIGCMANLAGVLRKAGRSGEAKALEGQVKMMQAQ